MHISWRSDDPDWEDCWNCGGAGGYSNCFSEFACVDPESGCEACDTQCDVCRGQGGWHVIIEEE